MDDAKCTATVGPRSGLGIFFLVFLPFALGHYVSSLLRNINAVLAPDLTAALALTPAQLGVLTSVFFFTFALVQLPVGIALDRHGPRRVQVVLMLLAGAGAVLFGMSHNFSTLLLARAVMGVGLGGCFMAAVKAVSTWIPPGRLPTVHGYLIAVGGLGSATGTLPVRMALQYTDWRGLFLMLAAATAIIGLLIFLLAPNHSGAAVARKPVTLSGVLDVYRDPAFRETISLMLVPHMIFFGVQGLWMGKWLSDVAHFSDMDVAYMLYWSMAGIIVGAVSVGQITEWAGRHGMRPLHVAAVGLVLFLLVQLGIVCNYDYAPSYRLLVVLFTMLGTITGLEYAIISQAMPAALTGRAATCLNLLIFVGAFLVQAGFGMILLCWSPDVHQQYPVPAYRAAFGFLIALQVPGLFGYWRRHLGGTLASGKMSLRTGHLGSVRNLKDEYETGALWPSGQGKARPD